jgi:hypothetical protein
MKTARAPEHSPYADRKRSWLEWGIAGVVVLAVTILAAIALHHFGARPPAEPMALSVYERDAQLRAADANEMDVLQLEHDALQDEVTRLRTQNAAQAERIQQLESHDCRPQSISP